MNYPIFCEDSVTVDTHTHTTALMLSISGAPRAATALVVTETSTLLADKGRDQKQEGLGDEQTAAMGRHPMLLPANRDENRHRAEQLARAARISARQRSR